MIDPDDYSIPSASEWRIMRAKLDMSVKEVAEKTGLSRATLNNLEKGANARVDTVKALLEVYRDEWESDDD